MVYTISMTATFNQPIPRWATHPLQDLVPPNPQDPPRHGQCWDRWWFNWDGDDDGDLSNIFLGIVIGIQIHLICDFLG